MVNTSAQVAAIPCGSARDDRTDLFPLELTPFEQYLMLEDTLDRPLTSFFDFRFSTPLQLPALERSLDITLHRNPLLASRVVREKNSWRWHYDPTCRVRVLSESDLPAIQFGRPRQIDLAQEPGVRLWYLPDGKGSRLLLQLHHASCDGVGFRRFMVDLCRSYAQLSVDPDAAVELDYLDADLLKSRFGVGKGGKEGCRSRLSNWQRLRNTYYFFCKLPQPLARPPSSSNRDSTVGSESDVVGRALLPVAQPGRNDPPTDAPCLFPPADRWPILQATLDRNVTEQILDMTRRQQISVNDLAIALLFSVCCRWNAEIQGVKSNAHLRILMPYDLRGARDLRMPATNRMSFAFLGRMQRECGDWSQLLQSVQAEVQAIKDTRLSLDFLGGLSVAVRHPWILKKLIGRCRNMSTVVLTYAGDVFRGLDRYFPDDNGERIIGDARLLSICGAPPVRIGTNISLAANLCNNQLTFAAAWSRDDFSQADCQRFIDRYTDAWSHWATEP